MGRLSDTTLSEDGYPNRPGFKDRDTSLEAAGAVASEAKSMREAALLEFKKAEPDGLTADEVAARLGQSVLAIRPRVSELVAALLIADTGRRRKNKSGLNAKVYRPKVQR